jgi:hypothetical protein
MTERAPIETTNLGSAEQQTAIEWSLVRDQLAAPPPPDTPGGHFPTILGTVRPDGRPHLTGVGARWYDGDLYFLSGPGTRKSRNLAANPACSIAMHLADIALVLDGEAAPTDDPALLAAVGDVIRQAGWPVELTTGGFTAPFGPTADAGPPWQLYRFVFHTAIVQGESGATRWRFARR